MRKRQAIKGVRIFQETWVRMRKRQAIKDRDYGREQRRMRAMAILVVS